MGLRYRLAAGLAQQHWPSSASQLRTRRFKVLQPAHPARHHQRLINGAPEQHTVIALAPANGGQQVLFSRQPLLDGKGQRLVSHCFTFN